MHPTRLLRHLPCTTHHPVSWVKVRNYLSPEGVRHGKSGRNPAVRIDHMPRKPIHDTLYRMSHILRRRDDQTAGHQECRGEEVVHAEDRTVHYHLLVLEVVTQPSQKLEHGACFATSSQSELFFTLHFPPQLGTCPDSAHCLRLCVFCL